MVCSRKQMLNPSKPYEALSPQQLAKAVLVVLLILGGLSVAGFYISENRETACAQKCRAAGVSSYEYKGFSVRWRNLMSDHCECVQGK